ncbi:amino acid kinase family protein [Halobacillus sp. B23F22_1]|uniref:amino acid kinase family protein n=1 Tax=Halobacillus sp. B23F22_1 TaxID=3459514 RepID=UPI00373E1633
MKTKIMKFGGTTLDSSLKRMEIAHLIKEEGQKYKLVVVVSAMGRMGSPYATDTLINYLKEKKFSKKEYSMLSSCGEVISSVVLSAELQTINIKSIALTGGEAGIQTHYKDDQTKIKYINSKKLEGYLDEGYIPIVAGFQGEREDRSITTLDRGGSDITGTSLGNSLNADLIEIYTDVAGIRTTDPSIVNDSMLISNLTYSQAELMANNGAEIIHPEAIKWASIRKIPILIKKIASNEETRIEYARTKSISKSNKALGITIDTNHQESKITIIEPYKELDSHHIHLFLLKNIVYSYAYKNKGNCISFKVSSEDMPKAIKLIHKALFMKKSQEVLNV